MIFEGMLKMIQKLSNRIIDLEKEREVQKTYKRCYQKREDNNQLKTPPHNSAAMNITEVGGTISAPFTNNLILKRTILNGEIQ